MNERGKFSPETMVQLVNFRLGGEDFGLNISTVREITRVTNITHVPDAPSFIRGVTNLRGEIIPVIDLGVQFGFARRDELKKSSRIVVTEIGEQTVGVLVDEVPEVSSLPSANIEPPPEIVQRKIRRDYIKGVGKLGEKLVIILDLEKVLAEQDVQDMARVGAPEPQS